MKSNEAKISSYEWYKSKGICPKCRVNDAFHGHVLCAECLEKSAIERQKYVYKRAEYQKKRNAVRKKQREERKQAGLCTRCGKKPQQHGQLCNECHMRRMKNRRALERQKRNGRTYGDAFRQRMEAGLCMYCGKIQVPGYKLCEDCLKKRQEMAKKIGIRNSEDGYMRKEVDGQWKQIRSKHSGNT